MGHCVFMLKSDSIYDDRPEEQYQFPKMYLGRAKDCPGDWIVYLEPTKQRGSRGYFAIARVQEIIPDPKAPDMFLAVIEPGSYLDFANSVPFNDREGPIERGLVNEQGRLSGRAQAAVRPISPADFLRIIESGINQTNPMLPRLDADRPMPGFDEENVPYAFETERQRLLRLTSRVVRDRVFRRIVLRAYDERCAVTGLKLINGRGRAEVDAAHIRPVEHNGPDTVHNGIALSGTAHWMFDRGLVSLTDDLEILVSRQVNDIGSVHAFINKSGRATPPSRCADRPHPHFLRWHRENCFKS
jgi:putative restriction endonuclease